MNMPFTRDQFLNVFADYNNAVWPVQIFLVIIALVAVYSSLKNQSWSNRAVGFILAFLWVWIGIVYHFVYFTTINKAAYAFGILNVVQGGIFFYYGFLKPSLSFHVQSDMFGLTGSVLIVYSLLIYPILGHSFGHIYPQSPTFGLPCPTTIFTFGLLLWTEKRVPLPVLIVPLIWAVTGSTAAFYFGIVEDAGLLVAGLVTPTLLILRNRINKTIQA